LVANPNAPAQIDVNCLLNGARPCATSSAEPLDIAQGELAPAHPTFHKSLRSVQLQTNISYRFMRECPEVTCSYVTGAVRPGERLDVTQLSDAPGWVKVQCPRNGRQGWLKEDELTERTE